MCALVCVQAEEISRKGTTYVAVGVCVCKGGRECATFIEKYGGEKKVWKFCHSQFIKLKKSAAEFVSVCLLVHI